MKFITLALLLGSTQASRSKGMCPLPGEAGFPEHLSNINLQDFSGKWYDVVIDKSSWGGEGKNPMCIENNFTVRPAKDAKEVVHDQSAGAQLKRKDFSSQADGFSKFLGTEDMEQTHLDVSSQLDGKREQMQYQAYFNSKGPTVYHSRSLKPQTNEPADRYGAFVASDPKEFLIRYTCTELGKDDEREERVLISVRDPNISEARINELMEMANQKITQAQTKGLEAHKSSDQSNKSNFGAPYDVKGLTRRVQQGTAGNCKYA